MVRSSRDSAKIAKVSYLESLGSLGSEISEITSLPHFSNLANLANLTLAKYDVGRRRTDDGGCAAYDEHVVHLGRKRERPEAGAWLADRLSLHWLSDRLASQT